MMFWALAFPMILGTLFYISFGNIGISATGDSDWDPVPVAVINKLETKSSGGRYADISKGNVEQCAENHWECKCQEHHRPIPCNL